METVYESSLEVECISIIYNNCILSYYEKCLASPWTLEIKIYMLLNSANP